MSKTIYEEAIKVIKYLQEQNSHLKDNCGTIYVSTENIATLEYLLIQSHIQEKLLELYKEINNKHKELIMLESFIIDEVDILLLQGYTFDEIVRAIKEYIAEHLAEEKENDTTKH